eukprot:CAMPEP_0203878092 /NCGR_PEP_ID=MMETSP0359-20131031/22654_1 /ASSEMBLY_ACC=CAM_ASM_000338 /TAXON_ID=268821 /ORGANISM="Scrippsiella Hangoei, Strain SHTV-5" /LENGTH=69 /DNA_ID=CAMNT_0050797187 /DNA_START=509 /DNA_END=718 /DNA_ORIENTATION=+
MCERAPDTIPAYPTGVELAQASLEPGAIPGKPPQRIQQVQPDIEWVQAINFGEVVVPSVSKISSAALHR